MNLLKKALGNALKNIARNKLINFLCFATIAFTLFIYGLFNYLTYNLGVFVDSFSKDIEAIFYFKDNVEQASIEALISRLRESLLVKEVSFSSKEQAEQKFSRDFPELQYILSEFKSSPFPPSLEVKFKQGEKLNIKITSLIEDVEKLTIIESKQVNLDWAEKFISIKKFVAAVGFFLSTILIVVSIFIIFNVIKLNILHRQDEINILSLVGATNWYIRFPFIIEGALLGLGGSLLSCTFLFMTLKIFPSYASTVTDIIKDLVNFSYIPTSIFLKLILLGTGIGFFSSLFSIRKFLKPVGEKF